MMLFNASIKKPSNGRVEHTIVSELVLIQNTGLSLMRDVRDPYTSNSDISRLKSIEQIVPEWFVQLLSVVSRLSP
jgi:hypothetical protein